MFRMPTGGQVSGRERETLVVAAVTIERKKKNELLKKEKWKIFFYCTVV